MRAARRYRGRMLRALLMLALLLAAGCSAPAPRGYYRPAGAPPQEALTPWVGQAQDALLEARCQGAYQNEVGEAVLGTVHVQLDVARTRSGDLVLPRDQLMVELPAVGEAPPRRLALSDVYNGTHRVRGDLTVPGWTRRPFDLFFDDPALLEHGPQPTLRLIWELRDADDALPASCDFELIPDDDPFAPSRLAPADEVFGLRNGYYLPGVTLGLRRLHTGGEERLHYLFHEPE